jgi:hypothetical protein
MARYAALLLIAANGIEKPTDNTRTDTNRHHARCCGSVSKQRYSLPSRVHVLTPRCRLSGGSPHE